MRAALFACLLLSACDSPTLLGGGLGRIVIAHGLCTQASNFQSAPDLPDAVCTQL